MVATRHKGLPSTVIGLLCDMPLLLVCCTLMIIVNDLNNNYKYTLYNPPPPIKETKSTALGG